MSANRVYMYMLIGWSFARGSLFFWISSTELARIKSTPTDSELAAQIDKVESKVRACVLCAGRS